MPLKLNISNKGKAWKLEVEPEVLAGKSIGDTIDGKEIHSDLEGYELEITGGSDTSGFPMYKEVEGIGLKRVLFKKADGWGLHKRPKGVRKKVPQPNGLRMRKTVRARGISEKVVQVNINVIAEGGKKLEEIFKDQNQPKNVEAPAEGAASTEAPKVEEKKEEVSEPKDSGAQASEQTEDKSESDSKEEVKEEKAEENSADKKSTGPSADGTTEGKE